MIRLAIRCRADDAELVLAELLELAPGGVEEVGPIHHPDAPGRGAEEAAGWFEYAIYGPPGEVPALPDLEAIGVAGAIEVSTAEIPDDWADRWRDFHQPAVIAGGRLVVRPSWEADPRPATDPDTPGREAEEVSGVDSEEVSGMSVVIDPGQAFGTGAHATTRICLELLLELADGGQASGPLLDLGTGSGVLAIAAARLGWAPVSGCDSEAAAVGAARANAEANGVEIALSRVNLRAERPPAAPTVVANLTAPLLRDVARSISAAPPRTLICSGLLATEVEQIEAVFHAVGLEPRETRFSGDWAGILFASST